MLDADPDRSAVNTSCRRRLAKAVHDVKPHGGHVLIESQESIGSGYIVQTPGSRIR